MMVRRMRADRERQAVAIHNRHDFHTFSALGRRHFGSATLGHREGRIDKAFFFVERSTFAKLVGDVRQDSTQYLAAAPRLETTMHRFVVRITLRQHVPLRAGVETGCGGCRGRLRKSDADRGSSKTGFAERGGRGWPWP